MNLYCLTVDQKMQSSEMSTTDNFIKKSLQSRHPEDERGYGTACSNTDDAVKFQSLKCSIWPIFLMINELPSPEKMSSLVTCGLWFHLKKPDMSVFRDPFVDITNNVNFFIEFKNEKIQIQLYVLSCCVDSSALAGIQGIKQYNGKESCNQCLHPEEYLDKAMRYPVKLNVNEQTHEETLKIMTENLIYVKLFG